MNKKTRIAFLSLFVMLLSTKVCSASAEGPSLNLAPLSPAFVEYAGDPETWKGLPPSPVDLRRPYVKPLSPDNRVSARGAGLPRKFDLRILGYVTPAKDQGNGNDCWAYTATGSMESTYLRKTGKALDLSEKHLSWFAYSSGQNAFTGDASGGGFDNNSVALLARWIGPVLESATSGKYRLSEDEADYPAILHLENAYFLGLEFIDDGDLYLKPDDDTKKRLVYENGAISAGMYSGGLNTNSRYYDKLNSAWFYNGEKRHPDHSVLIVGWDDDYPRTNFSAQNQPYGDGAWLIKNSWGSTFGQNGYFWISYEDVSFVDGVLFLAGEAGNYDKNYGYDGLGWCMSSGVGAGETAWLSNVFRSTEEENIEAVSFYATSNRTAYEIYIYTKLADASDPRSGTLVSKKSGTLDLAGYHTVPLQEAAAPLIPGTSFSVVVKVTTPGYAYPAAVETRIEGYSDNAIIEPGVSFISADGDLWGDAAEKGANVCVRAFTSKEKPGGDDGKGGEDSNPGGEAASGGGCTTGAALLLAPLLAAVFLWKGPLGITQK
ncbi:MAG: lectin like domain-containing protein [Synergistaceae bacterium]|jgi:C1A family cysteine protease|nr:lectin like domain-containing protein [Synergistaceae bacterium]